MSLKSPQKLDEDEVEYIGILGWFATLAVTIAAVAVVGM